MAVTQTLHDAVADYCHPEIELGKPCVCIQAHGYREEMLASPACAICGGTGRPTKESIISGVGALNDEIDQLASRAVDICAPAKVYLDLAWWHTENAIRQLTGHCSMACTPATAYCPCCQHYHELKAKAERIGRAL